MVPADLLFAFNSATLLPEANQYLAPIAARASAGSYSVSITGQASPDGGTASYNLRLSALRARAVQHRLITLSLGGSPDRPGQRNRYRRAVLRCQRDAGRDQVRSAPPRRDHAFPRHRCLVIRGGWSAPMGTHSPAGQRPAPSMARLTSPSSGLPGPSLHHQDTAGAVRRDHDLAEADRIRRWRPRSLMLLTRYKISVRKRPRMSRRAVRALVAEQEGTAVRDPARATHGELVVHSAARRKAERRPPFHVPAVELAAQADRPPQGQEGDAARLDQPDPARAGPASPRGASHGRADTDRPERAGRPGERRARPELPQARTPASLVPSSSAGGAGVRLPAAPLLPVRHHRR